jgi:hypothetical protein
MAAQARFMSLAGQEAKLLLRPSSRRCAPMITVTSDNHLRRHAGTRPPAPVDPQSRFVPREPRKMKPAPDCVIYTGRVQFEPARLSSG